ncbi:MAG: DUF2794 domain-containing protein [Salaquimonas sp.]
MSDQPDLRKDNERTTIVRTVVLNEGAKRGINLEQNTKKVVNLQSSTTTSNNAQNQRKQQEIVTFNRKELDQILWVYGFKVAAGEWKDYAIDMLKDRAVFSVFRRAHDTPLHCIEKNPKLATKQGIYSVTGSDGRILKRGHDLSTVLKVIEKKPKLRVV